jgi:AraC family transcriptional regulator
MMGDPLLFDRRGRPIATPGVTLIDSTPAAWQGFPLEVTSIHGSGEACAFLLPVAAIAMCSGGGNGCSDVRIGRSTVSLPFSHGVLALQDAGIEVDSWKWRGSTDEIVSVQFTPDILAELTHGEARLPSFQTQWRDEDETISSLITAMHRELKRGCGSGRMYAQGLSLALIGYVQHRYGTSAARRRTPGTIPPREMARVADYIHQHLARDISVDDLASLLNLSSSQFARLFKKTAGASPYQYLQRKRIERAIDLMRGPDSLAQIAQDVGFSSQSHFTEVFRAVTGTTPAIARAEQAKGFPTGLTPHFP